MLSIIDFSIFTTDLFTGRKNGQDARTVFGLSGRTSNAMAITCKDEQLITSSYFIGLLDHLYPNGSLFIDLSGLNDKSLSEFNRAMRRIAERNIT